MPRKGPEAISPARSTGAEIARYTVPGIVNPGEPCEVLHVSQSMILRRFLASVMQAPVFPGGTASGCLRAYLEPTVVQIPTVSVQA